MTLDLTPTLPPLTVAQAAPVLNFSVDAVYDAVARGEIHALRLGRSIRIPRAEIARLLGVSPETTSPEMANGPVTTRAAALATTTEWTGPDNDAPAGLKAVN